ncbi:unnamed protein product [Choristocarpus tenellus]
MENITDNAGSNNIGCTATQLLHDIPNLDGILLDYNQTSWDKDEVEDSSQQPYSLSTCQPVQPYTNSAALDAFSKERHILDNLFSAASYALDQDFVTPPIEVDHTLEWVENFSDEVLCNVSDAAMFDPDPTPIDLGNAEFLGNNLDSLEATGRLMDFRQEEVRTSGRSQSRKRKCPPKFDDHYNTLNRLKVVPAPVALGGGEDESTLAGSRWTQRRNSPTSAAVTGVKAMRIAHPLSSRRDDPNVVVKSDSDDNESRNPIDEHRKVIVSSSNKHQGRKDQSGNQFNKRKKVDVEELKQQVAELLLQQQLIKSGVFEPLPASKAEQVRVRRSAVRKFLDHQTHACADKASWASFLDEAVTLTLPAPPVKDDALPVDSPSAAGVGAASQWGCGGSTVFLESIEEIMADAEAMHRTIVTIGAQAYSFRSESHNRAPRVGFVYHVAPGDILIVDNQAMCHWQLTTEGLMAAGLQRECIVDGMMHCRFTESSKIESLELIYDALGFTNQLRSCSLQCLTCFLPVQVPSDIDRHGLGNSTTSSSANTTKSSPVAAANAVTHHQPHFTRPVSTAMGFLGSKGPQAIAPMMGACPPATAEQVAAFCSMQQQQLNEVFATAWASAAACTSNFLHGGNSDMAHFPTQHHQQEEDAASTCTSNGSNPRPKFKDAVDTGERHVQSDSYSSDSSDGAPGTTKQYFTFSPGGGDGTLVHPPGSVCAKTRDTVVEEGQSDTSTDGDTSLVADEACGKPGGTPTPEPGDGNNAQGMAMMVESVGSFGKTAPSQLRSKVQTSSNSCTGPGDTSNIKFEKIRWGGTKAYEGAESAVRKGVGGCSAWDMGMDDGGSCNCGKNCVPLFYQDTVDVKQNALPVEREPVESSKQCRRTPAVPMPPPNLEKDCPLTASSPVRKGEWTAGLINPLAVMLYPGSTQQVAQSYFAQQMAMSPMLHHFFEQAAIATFGSMAKQQQHEQNPGGLQEEVSTSRGRGSN